MKTILSSALALMAAAAATTVQAADDVKLQLQWVTQAQFAGYYVALDKGFYTAEDLNVTILPVSFHNPAQIAYDHQRPERASTGEPR